MTDLHLPYPNKEQCPCCGRIDRPLIARLIDDTVNTHTEGTISGSGIGMGTGGVGIGVGFARVNLNSVSQTRLQSNSERVQLAQPHNTKDAIKGIVIGLIIIGMIAVGFNMVSGMQPSPDEVAIATDPMTKMNGEMSNLLPMMMVFPIIAMIAFIGGKIFSTPRAMINDEQQAHDNRLLAQKLEQYYRTLRYCDNCHVVFDQAGYSCFVEHGAVLAMSKNAGIFDGRAIETNRVVNQTIMVE